MPEETALPGGAPRSKDEVALELMKFISIQTGYGKGIPAAGFTGKQPVRPADDQAAALLELFERCRDAVYQIPAGSGKAG